MANFRLGAAIFPVSFTIGWKYSRNAFFVKSPEIVKHRDANGSTGCENYNHESKTALWAKSSCRCGRQSAGLGRPAGQHNAGLGNERRDDGQNVSCTAAAPHFITSPTSPTAPQYSHLGFTVTPSSQTAHH